MKIIDGITLLKMITDGTITNKTKLNCVDWVISNSNNKVYVNSKGIVKWEVSNIALTQEMLIKYHFEILEDKEYEDIEELSYVGYTSNTHEVDKELYYIRTINALIRNQKYILERINRGE